MPMFEWHFFLAFWGKWGCLGLALPDIFDKKSFKKLVVMIKGTHRFKPPKNGGILNGNEMV